MPVAVRRAVVARTGTNEAAGSGQRSARSDRRGTEVLDVISVSPVPDGPFGQDRPYGPADARVNRVVHQGEAAMAASIHEFSTAVDSAWTNGRASPPSRTSRAGAGSTRWPRSAPGSSDRHGRARPSRPPRGGRRRSMPDP